jgi:hypothetical protein
LDFEIETNSSVNSLALAQSFSCTFSHIHREGNPVADALAKNGHNGHSMPSLYSQWWTKPPHFILPLLHRDSTGLPFLRTVTV